ncbi:MAG: hypothetical protein LBF25_03190 [Puniceicoccales bacterium]|nr:hypothetical protein [Puniceicoccales bacterium]
MISLFFSSLFPSLSSAAEESEESEESEGAEESEGTESPGGGNSAEAPRGTDQSAKYQTTIPGTGDPGAGEAGGANSSGTENAPFGGGSFENIGIGNIDYEKFS